MNRRPHGIGEVKPVWLCSQQAPQAVPERPRAVFPAPPPVRTRASFRKIIVQPGPGRQDKEHPGLGIAECLQDAETCRPPQGVHGQASCRASQLPGQYTAAQRRASGDRPCAEDRSIRSRPPALRAKNSRTACNGGDGRPAVTASRQIWISCRQSDGSSGDFGWPPTSRCLRRRFAQTRRHQPGTEWRVRAPPRIIAHRENALAGLLDIRAGRSSLRFPQGALRVVPGACRAIDIARGHQRATQLRDGPGYQIPRAAAG